MIHLSGLKASIYWASFPETYLRTIHKLGVSKLSGGIRLRRTRPQSLIDHEQRTTFLRDMIAVIRCLADGRANVGLLRRIPEGPIHREMIDSSAMTDEGVSSP